MKRNLQGRVTETLGLPLNEQLQRGCFSRRIEYGVESDYAVSFEISNFLGGFSLATEEKFAAHSGERAVAIVGEGTPVEAMRLIRETYPDARLWMRLDGKRRRKPRASRKTSRKRERRGTNRGEKEVAA